MTDRTDRKLRVAIDTISPDPLEGSGGEGLFDSIIDTLQTLPGSKSDEWANLTETMSGYKAIWDEWHSLADNIDDAPNKHLKWKGTGSLSYKCLYQTVHELCQALEAGKNAPLP